MDKRNMQRRRVDMALLAKPCNHIIAIKPEKEEKFILDSKNNTISKKELEKCFKYASIIKHA